MKEIKAKHIICPLLIVVMILPMLYFSLPVAAQSNVSNAKQQYDAFRYTSGVTQYPYVAQYYNPAGTATTQSDGPKTNHTLWVKPLSRITGTAVAYGRIWVSYVDPYSTIMSLDAYTGEIIWKMTSNSKLTSTSAPYLELSNERVSMGFIYTVFNDNLGCYQASDGALVWELPRSKFQSYIGNATLGSGFGPIGPTDSKYIFVGDYFGQYPDPAGAHFWAITKGRNGGKIAWAAPPLSNATDYWNGGPASYANGIVYAGEYTANGHMNAFNATNGKLLWSTALGGWSTYGTAILNGVVYATADSGADAPNGGILALDAGTGAVLWRFNVTGVPMSNPVIYNNSVYEAVFVDNKLYILDKNTGTLQLTMDSPGGGRGMTLANGKIYGTAYGDADFSGAFKTPGFFYSLDPNTNSLLWKYQLNNTGAYSRGFAVADGIAYAGDLAAKFYAFGMGPTTTEISVTNANVARGTAIAVYGKVYDESPASPGAPVANSPVELLAQKVGDTSWSSIGGATTDSAGRFVSQWTPPSEGTFNVMAKFDGTNDYGWSSSRTTVQVNPQSTQAPAQTQGPSSTQGPTTTPASASEIAAQVVAKLPTFSTADIALIAIVAIVAILLVVLILQVRKMQK